MVFVGGAAYSPDGFYPELLELEKELTADAFDGTPYRTAYDSLAPDPDRWAALVEKVRQLDLGWTGWRGEDVRAIDTPTLLVIGDADIVRPEHAVEMFRLLGGGVPGDIRGLPRSQLAVLPGTTHVTVMERTGWLLTMIEAFLEAPAPKAR
jgi:pimeloyl-ACP methyl ester carboxylesterase